MTSRNKSGAGLRIDFDKVSHGGHGATEGFLAVDEGFDAGPKLGFAKIKNRAETQILRRMYVRTCNIYQSSVPPRPPCDALFCSVGAVFSDIDRDGLARRSRSHGGFLSR